MEFHHGKERRMTNGLGLETGKKMKNIFAEDVELATWATC